MKLSDYYRRINDRSEAWVDRAFESGFAPCKEVIEAARSCLKTGGRVLDIGCQGGHQVALIRSNYSEAFGIDIAAYDRLWASMPSTNFIVHDVDAAPLPFPDGYFSCILCMNVLEHVFDVFGLTREISRTLEVGGTCLI